MGCARLVRSITERERAWGGGGGGAVCIVKAAIVSSTKKEDRVGAPVSAKCQLLGSALPYYEERYRVVLISLSLSLCHTHTRRHYYLTDWEIKIIHTHTHTHTHQDYFIISSYWEISHTMNVSTERLTRPPQPVVFLSGCRGGVGAVSAKRRREERQREMVIDKGSGQGWWGGTLI